MVQMTGRIPKAGHVLPSCNIEDSPEWFVWNGKYIIPRTKGFQAGKSSPRVWQMLEYFAADNQIRTILIRIQVVN